MTVQLFGQALSSADCAGIFNVTHISIRASEGGKTFHNAHGLSQPAERRFPEGALRPASQNRALPDPSVQPRCPMKASLQASTRPEPDPQNQPAFPPFPLRGAWCLYDGLGPLETPTPIVAEEEPRKPGLRGARGVLPGNKYDM